MTNQLNKLQIKAEILTIISKLQTNIEASNVEEVLKGLSEQEDKDSILEILLKELTKANEEKGILICFLLLKLCEFKKVEDSLWELLKSPTVKDSIKTVILNILKDMGNKVNYSKIEEYFDNPDEVIDADTQRLLQIAIVNPEAQIDFLDFASSLSDVDKKILLTSLGDDYTSDNLANILNPLFLYEPTTEIGKMALNILGSTKSQLALHTLNEALEFVDDEETVALIKKNISTLKISGVREDNAIDFYKSILSSAPYLCYISFPDGHGNQALIFSREKENDHIQIVAIVVNDTVGIVDCFGFNDISKAEFDRIVDRFYNGDEHIFINPTELKTILVNAEKLTRKFGKKISYEYICWRNLLSDIEIESKPIEITLKSKLNSKPLSEEDLDQIFMFDFVQRWFYDTESNDEFRIFTENLNQNIKENDMSFDFNELVMQESPKIFTAEQKDLLDKRILMSSYLKLLSENNEEAQLLYSLYFDENKKKELAETILKKSIYEYYVTLKFKQKDESKMKNIFAMRNKQKTTELSIKQIDLVISIIEGLWVKG